MSAKVKPLLSLKDGDILSFEDSHWGGGGGCDTCGYGGECDSDLTIKTTEADYQFDGVNGSKALTFIMHNLKRIPGLTVDDFADELLAYLNEGKDSWGRVKMRRIT